MAEAVQGNDQRRHPGLGARLDSVRTAASAGRRAERPLHRARRRRLLGDELLRRSDRHTEHRSHRGGRCALHAVAHDRVVLADALMPADRAEPHAQQHGVHHGGGDRFSERERHDPARERDALGDPRRGRLEHLHGRQVAPVPDRRDEPRVDAPELADRPRVRTLVRVPRRGDEPVVSGSRLRQPHGRPAALAGRRLSPDRRHHRQGARVHQGRQGDRAREAVLPLLRAGCMSCTAPRAEGVERQVQGPLRHGLRGDARADTGSAEGTGAGAGGHGAAADQPDRDARHAHRTGRRAVPAVGLHASVGVAERRREASVRAHGGGVRGIPRPRRSSHRPTARLVGGERRAGQHHRRRRLRQRRERRGWSRTAR